MSSEAESDLNCIICMEVYEEETHPPRTLRCGHTLCTPCLRALLDKPPGQRSCPECRHAIKITSVEHVAVSYAVLRLARALEQARAGTVPDTTQESCPKHSRAINARCTLAQRWVCSRCQCHPACTHLVPVADALLEMKNKKVQETEATMDQLTEVGQKLRKISDDLRAQQEEVNRQLALHTRLVGSLEEAEARVVQASTPTIFTRAVTCHTNSLKESRIFISNQRTNTTTSTTTSTTKTPNGTHNTKKGWESPAITPATPSPSPPLNTLIGLEPLRDKLRMTRNLYAECELCGEKKYSKLTLRGSDICMHSLSNDPPPPDAILVSFESLRGSWNDGQYQQRAFLDLSIGGRVEGRVEILLFQRTPRAETFADLCVGELGYSYKGHQLNFDVWEGFKLLQMWCGSEYIGEEGQKHPATSLHIAHYRDAGPYRRQVFPGLVAGAPSSAVTHLATFRIHMFTAKGHTDNMGFGKVESGLGLIRYAHSEKESKVAFIHDCGLLFPL